MAIDLDVALGAEFGQVEFSWNATNVQLYNLGLGAGSDPMDPRELSYVVDRTRRCCRRSAASRRRSTRSTHPR